MHLLNIGELKPAELTAIKKYLGGTYNIAERLSKNGIGSPFLYYGSGWESLDTLNDRASDMLKINFEELKDGFLLRIAERTNGFLAPVLYSDVHSIRLYHTKSQSMPRAGSIYDKMIHWKVPPAIARWFATRGEFRSEEVRLSLDFDQYPTLNLWTNPNYLEELKAYLLKSPFSQKLVLS